MPQAPADLATFEAKATTVAGLLRTLANERRLMVLCKLVEWGEDLFASLRKADSTFSARSGSQRANKLNGFVELQGSDDSCEAFQN